MLIADEQTGCASRAGCTSGERAGEEVTSRDRHECARIRKESWVVEFAAANFVGATGECPSRGG